MKFLNRRGDKFPEILMPFHTIDGWLSEKEALGLYTIARKLPKNAIVVEIGSWKGKSTFCLACGLKNGNIIAIDPFNADAVNDVGSKEEYLQKKGPEDLLLTFQTNMESRGVMEKIIIKKGYSSQFQKETGDIDFLFIDGDHSIEGCKEDFEMYAPKLKRGGYLAFHDYYPDRPELGPTFVINNILAKKKEYRFYKNFDTLWIAEKRTN